MKGANGEEHTVRRMSDGRIEDRYELGKNDLNRVHSQLYYSETTRVWCSCGEEFDDLDEAEEHLLSVDPARNPRDNSTGTNRGDFDE